MKKINNVLKMNWMNDSQFYHASRFTLAMKQVRWHRASEIRQLRPVILSRGDTRMRTYKLIQTSG